MEKLIIVELLKDEPRFKIKKGELFEAKTYALDPMVKVTLIRRISDGFIPDCNEYRHNVKILYRTNKN
jgi:hypothetical protein